MSGQPTFLTCPECRGPLALFENGPVWEVRCRVGHAYAPEALVNAHEETLERTLWAAVVALEEGVEISALLDSRRPGEARRLKSRKKMAERLRELISDLGETATITDSRQP